MERSSYGTGMILRNQNDEKSNGSKSLREDDEPAPCISAHDDDYLLQREKHLTGHLTKRWKNAAIAVSCISIVFTLIVGITAFSISSIAKSSAAFGFAFDSLLDVITTIVVVWRFIGKQGDFYSWEREQRACKILSVCFVVSGIGIFVRGLRVLIIQRRPHEFGGIQIISSISLIAYCILSWCKLVIAEKISSSSLQTDGYNSLAGAVLAFGMLMSSLAYDWDKSIWFLDACIALCIALALIVYGIRLLSTMMAKPPEAISQDSEGE